MTPIPMLKIHSVCGVNTVSRGYVLLCGANAAKLNSFRGERALSSSEFLACAQRMAADLNAHPPPLAAASQAESFGDKLTQAVQRQLGARSARNNDNTSPAASEETFAQKLTRITKKKAKQRSV